MVTIMDLTGSSCRWPMGEQDFEFRYCGNPVGRGAYCAHHGFLSYQTPAQAKHERERDKRLALAARWCYR